MKTIAIIGGGISGISAGKMLQDQFDVTVFEKSDGIGGLIRCQRVNDNLFHRVGGHVFNSKNEDVLTWFWSHFNKENEFVTTKRNAKILLGGRLIGYPLENYLYMLDRETAESVIKDLISLNKKGQRSPHEHDNFEEFLKANFGPTLYHLYFQPYNQKLWNTDLQNVAMDWLEGKLPMPDYRRILCANILREDESEMVHATFYYACDGGSQFIVDRLATGLKIKYNAEVNSVSRCGNQYSVNGDAVFDYVIYCGDIRKIPQIYTTRIAALEALAPELTALKSNGTSNLFCETDDNDLTWLYLPDEGIRAHRIIYTGNLSRSNNRGSSRKTCVVEFSGKVSHDKMCAELSQLPGNLKPLTSNYEANSYVIQDGATRPLVKRLRKILEPGFYLLGRFAEWEYYNMDKCMERAMAVREQIIENEGLLR